VKYLAKTITEYIIEQVNRQNGTLKFVLPSYPAELLWEIGTVLNEAISRMVDRKVEFVYGVAYRLGQKWETSGDVKDVNHFKQIKKEGWYNEKNNLTSLRNRLRKTEDDCLLIILAGYEDIDDQSSLLDFFHLDQKSVLEICLNASYQSWVEESLKDYVNLEDSKTYTEAISRLLMDIYDYGIADLLGISYYLQSRDFSGVSNGKEAYRLILDDLSSFKLPRMNGLARKKTAKSFLTYLGHAQGFFNYSKFLNISDRNKVLKKIEAFGNDSDRIDPDINELGDFESIDDLLKTLKEYIQTRSEEARQRLYSADFIYLNEKILGYRTRSKKKQANHKKLYGVAPEVFLRALWLTLGEMKREATPVTFMPDSLKKITIRSILFKHDYDAGGEEDEHEAGKSVLRRALGGIDEFLQDKIRLIRGSTDDSESIPFYARLCPQSDEGILNFEKTRSAVPYLEFEVIITNGDGNEFKKKFRWMLSENHPTRLLVDLYDWVWEEYSKASDDLPAFAIPYMAEVFMARDEDDANRLLKTALQGGRCYLYDLLDIKAMGSTEVLTPLLFNLSQNYQGFLTQYHNEGFFMALNGRFNELRRDYINTCRTYLEHSQVSVAGPLLLKAFMVVSNERANESSWEWEPHMDAGIVTPLHPALLDMMNHQNSYLCNSFSYYASRLLEDSNRKAFAEKKWDQVVDLAAIKWPIIGTLSGFYQSVDTNVSSFGYIHFIGRCPEPTSFLNARLLLEYEEDEDEEITDTELFRETRASALITQILRDYLRLHDFASDGITVGAYCGQELQPVIAGIDGFLSRLLNNREEPYALRLIVYSDSKDDTAVLRWVNAWKERWQQAELASTMKHYGKCRVSIAYRVITNHENSEQFKKLLRDTDTDIMFFTDFVKSTASVFEVLGDESYQPHDYSRFPVLEKVCCQRTGGGQEYWRERILSNQRFQLGSIHTEVMARLRNKEQNPRTKNVVISRSDFQPWNDIIDVAHENNGWVVCIDPSVDERLLLKMALEGESGREIIGCGTGVGSHGEKNFTISTEKFSMVDIKQKISSLVSILLGPIEADTADKIADSLVREAIHISGLSLVKATGPMKFVREFIANTMARKLLVRQEDCFCDEIIALDAFSHWFNDADDGMRPDLIRLKARIVDGYFNIDVQVIECKLAQQSDDYLEIARQQVENGLKELIPRFRPHEVIRPSGIEGVPDERYWWMQLHRLIASKGATTMADYKDTLMALERLSEGYFNISWQAAVLAFWTDMETDSFNSTPEWNYGMEGQEMDISVASGGKHFIRKACLENAGGKIFSSDRKIEFQSYKNHVIEKDDGVEQETGVKPAGKAETVEMDNEILISGEMVGQSEKTTGFKSLPPRILLGRAIGTNREVFWEFGHPDLANRHLLVFGASGTGKTYTIQALLCELARHGQNSLIVDYTNGFTTNQLESPVVHYLHPEQHVIRLEPLAINPFRQQCEVIDDIDLPEDPANTAQRVSGVFAEVYQLGDQQKSALYNAIRQGVSQESLDFNLVSLTKILENMSGSGGPAAGPAASVLTKIQPFIDMNPFGREDPESWEKIYNDQNSQSHIIQLAGFMKDTARLITEFSLIDLYWYYRATGNKDDAKVIVLDEIQNLDHRLDSPLGQFLTEGRKFGISLILATQTLSNLNKDERDRLFQASHKLFFKPADTEIKSFAGILADATGENQEDWVTRLSLLKRGECYSLGCALNAKTGNLDVNKWFKIRVTEIEKRIPGGS
jgi:DNA phosphorothioation-dependent restriction protein DptH